MSEASTPDAAAPLRLRDFPDYLRLMLARISGTTANQMLMVALGWQMYDLTGSAWDLGLVGLYQFVPALALTLPAGHLADRYDRRGLLAISLLIQAAVATLLLWGSWGLWIDRDVVLATSVMLGMARALQMPSLSALTPSLVPPALLPRAVALSSTVMQAAIVAGPALGGALYAWGPQLLAQVWPNVPRSGSGPASVYGTSLLLLCLAVLGVAAIRTRAKAAEQRAASFETLTAGVRFIWQRPVLLGAISLDLFAVLLGGAVALLPIFAKDILHTGPEGLGVLRAAPACGALVVGLWLARRPIERKAGAWLLGAVAVFGVSTIVFGLSTHFGVALVALAVSGASDMVSVVLRQSLVQLETPDEMRGRVAAVNSVFIGASNQLGEFESGVTAAWWGPVGAVVVGGVGTLLVVAGWTRLFPDLARRDQLYSPKTA